VEARKLFVGVLRAAGVVSDIDAVHAELVERGVEATEVQGFDPATRTWSASESTLAHPAVLPSRPRGAGT